MRLHGTFYALKPSAQSTVEMLNADEVFDGAYSRVVPIAPYAVLKATICEPTNLLLRALIKRRSRSPHLPSLALPGVIAAHGVIAKDDDELKYTCWTLERLFAPDDHGGMRRARVCGREVLTRAKPGYAQRYCNLSTNQVSNLQEALTQLQQTWGHENGWEACAHIALAMSLRTKGELKDTFLFLQKFVTTHKVALDLLTRGNVLVNLFGELTLSDPVCENDETQQPSPACASEYLCLSAWVPSAMSGLSLLVRPLSTGPMSAGTLLEKAEHMKSLGLAPQAMVWGSSEHVSFLEEPPREAKVWAFDNAVQRLREKRYLEVFGARTPD